MQNEQEIKRDLPLLRQKIDRCYKSMMDLQKAIMGEQEKISELDILIREEKARPEGKRPRYDISAMSENIERHRRNIETFRETIQKEENTISKTEAIILVLEEDLRTPTELVFDMRSPNQRG